MKISMYNIKFRAMGGCIVLAILFGFFITGIQPQPDQTATAERFFKKERSYLATAKSMVLRRIGNHRYTDWPGSQEEAEALVYVTFLSFWIAVDFKICKIYYSSFNNDSYYNNMCHSYYKDTAAAFKEFRNIIQSSRDDRAYYYEDDESFEIAVHEIDRLSLDLVTYAKTLVQKGYEYCYISSIIRWRMIKRASNVYSVFPYKKQIIQTLQERQYGEDRYNFIHEQMKKYINKAMLLIVYNIFFKKMTNEVVENSGAFISLFNESQFLRHESIIDALNTNYINEITSKTERAIEVIRIIRSVDYQKVLENYETNLENLHITDDSGSSNIFSFYLD